MRTTRQPALWAILPFLLLSLTSCASAPPCKPIVSTQTVTVYRDRYVTADPVLLAPVLIDYAWPAPPVTITVKNLDEHDAAATNAVARCNAQFGALRCAGMGGDFNAAECTPNP